MSENYMDCIPDKLDLYGSGEEESESDYDFDYDYGFGCDDDYEPEMSQEQFSEILEGYEADNASLKAALLAVCGHYVRTVPGRASRLAWTVAALAEYNFVFIPDLCNPSWYANEADLQCAGHWHLYHNVP